MDEVWDTLAVWLKEIIFVFFSQISSQKLMWKSKINAP